MIVGILTAANGKIGGGHLVRMQEVQKIFTSKDILCELFLDLNDLVDFFQSNDKDQLVVLIDLPHNYKINLDKLHSLDKCLKVGYELSKHMIPDYNIVPYQFKHREFKAKSEIMSGLQYLIIRSEIRNVKHDKNYNSSSILISLGSGETYASAVKVLKNITKLNKNKFKISIVIGAHDKKRFKFRRNVVSSPKNFPQLLNSSNIVFTNGGTTLVESLYLGKSVYCLPQNDDEKEFSLSLSKHYRFKLIEDLSKNVKLDLEPKMEDSSDNLVIDGLGGERVVNLICSLSIENEVI
jgi:spore coat polysaccharide biosynthesis predicted glycosyltransferase SpsG